MDKDYGIQRRVELREALLDFAEDLALQADFPWVTEKLEALSDALEIVLSDMVFHACGEVVQTDVPGFEAIAIQALRESLSDG